MLSKEKLLTPWEPIIKGFKFSIPLTSNYIREFGGLLLLELLLDIPSTLLSERYNMGFIFPLIAAIAMIASIGVSIYVSYKTQLWIGDRYWNSNFSELAPNFQRYFKFSLRYSLLIMAQLLGFAVIFAIGFFYLKKLSFWLFIPTGIYFLSIRGIWFSLFTCMYLKEADVKTARKPIDSWLYKEFWSNSSFLWIYILFSILLIAFNLGLNFALERLLSYLEFLSQLDLKAVLNVSNYAVMVFYSIVFTPGSSFSD